MIFYAIGGLIFLVITEPPGRVKKCIGANCKESREHLM